MLAHHHPQLKGYGHVVFVDSSRQYIDCSDGVVHLLGYTREDFLKKSIDEISYWLDGVPSLFKEFLRRGKMKGEYLLRHKSGAPFPIRYRSMIFPDGCKAAVLEPITDWQAAYLAVLSESNADKLGPRVDIALAAIYRRLYSGNAKDLEPNKERGAIVDALSALGTLRSEVGSALNPELLALEKTRSALLRLAYGRPDRDAMGVLLEENRLLIKSTLQQWFHPNAEDKALRVLLDRLTHKARFYNPDEDPAIWLHNCLQLECKRLKTEMHRLPNPGSA
jgi:hypothetical protein